MDRTIYQELVEQEQVQALKAAGLDRLNHNINTSATRYAEICQSHSYEDRIRTLTHAHDANLDVCSGVIIGMGESATEIIEMAKTLQRVKAKSIPVNFLVPIEGNELTYANDLSPIYCLRVLALFRFLHPRVDLRAGAGREGHLRGMEVLSLYPADSLFLDGYLNTQGGETQRVLQMIKDAGFEIDSDFTVDELLEKSQTSEQSYAVDGEPVEVLKHLRR